MKPKSKITFLLAFPGLASITALHAQTWIAGSGDFRTSTNWSPSSVPGAGSTASINNGGTASIAAGPQLDLGRLLLGGDGSGTTNAVGNLTIDGGVTLLSSSLNAESIIGNVAQDRNTVGTSTLILNGGEVQVDDPAGVLSGKSGLGKRFDFTGTAPNTWETSGFNNKDLLLGIRTRGRMELHGGAKLHVGDDLGIANSSGAGGNEAIFVMDGTSLVALGSGSEIGKTNSVVSMTLAGNSVFASGNSLGPGNPAGQTDEGYITIGTRDSGVQNITINNAAELQCITFQNRLGTTNITLNDQGKLKIHDVFAGSGTVLATRPSYVASGAPCNTTITLRDSSVMLVDCLLGNTASGGSNSVNGLHLGGGENLQSAVASDPGTYNSTAGGTAILNVGGNALLDIRQGLHLGFGTAASSSGTLRVVGPDATVQIGGNLNLAFNEYIDALSPGTGPRPGTGALHFVITGSTQAPVQVDGQARIANGTLKLSLQGYIPPRGTSYTLVQAAGVNGSFKTIDVSEAPLSGTNIWDITSTDTSVTATVADPLQTIDTTPDVTLLAPINIGANLSVTDIIGTGTLSLDGGGVVGLGNNGFGHIVNLNMTGGLIDVFSGVTLQNGGWQSGIWTNNRSSLNLAGGAFLDVWDGNPVRVDALTGSGTVTISINGAGNRSLTLGVNNGSGTFDGVIQNGTGSLSLTKEGTGTQELTGAVTHSGATTVTGGVLRFIDQAPRFSTTLVLGSGGTLQLDISTTPTTFDGAHVQLGAEGGTTVTGTGAFVKSGAGILALDGQGGNHAVTFNMTGGVIDIQQGTLKNGGWDGGIWGNNKASMNLASGAIFDIWNGQSVVVDALTGAGIVDSSKNGTLQTLTVGANNGSGTFSGVFRNTTGSLGLIKIGSGTQTLTGANTYSGDTIVHEGTLAINGNSIADSNKLAISGGTVHLTGAETVNTLFFGPTQRAPGTYSANGAGGTIASANFTGSGTLIVTAGPTDRYASWIDSPAFNSPPLSAAQKLATADPDNDGMNNLLEYALNGNPSASDPVIRPMLDDSGSTFVFSYNRFDDSREDTTQTFQYGSDLSGWTNVLVPATSGTVGAATVTVTPGIPADAISISIPKTAAGATGKLFGRLKVVK